MQIKLAESENELSEILALQRENQFHNISDEQKKTDGFVTVKHDLAVLQKMNEQAGHVIAVDGDRVVGYALVMVRECRDLVPVLIPMFEILGQVQYQGVMLSEKNYYVMGQVCVAETHRGKGVFQALYQKHKETYSGQYDLCVTEVSTSNPRSMKAHEKVGFNTIHRYRDETDEWNVLVWEWGEGKEG